MSDIPSHPDFCIDSTSLAPSGQAPDPSGSQAAGSASVLRHASDQFSKNALLVLRAMQLAARYDLAISPDTVELSRNLRMDGLAADAVFAEWRELIVHGAVPSRGLTFLREAGWLRYFPELQALIGCKQDPEWHPEGDAWIHTLHVMDAFAKERTGEEREDLVVGLACLCHDFGKPSTTAFVDGRIRARGHEAAGEPFARSFLSRMTSDEQLIGEVLPLVAEHMAPDELYKRRAGPRSIRRLRRKVEGLDRLVRVARADKMGRPPLRFDGFPAGQWLLKQAEQLDRPVEAPAIGPVAIVTGNHLIQLGLRPGRSFRAILEACFKAQMEGQFESEREGMEWARRLIATTDAHG